MADPSILPETFFKYGPVWGLVAVLLGFIVALARVYRRDTNKRLTVCDDFMKAFSESTAESGQGRQALMAAIERMGTTVTTSVDRVGDQVRDLKTRVRDQAVMTMASRPTPTSPLPRVDDEDSGPIGTLPPHRRR